MSLSENINIKLREKKERLEQIEQDLLLEEVLLDKKLTIRLEKEKKQLLPIVETYAKYTLGASDLEEKLVSMLVCLEKNMQKATIELIGKKGGDERLLNFILNSYENFCINEKLSYETQKKLNRIYVSGERVFDMFVGENGVHKSGTNKILVYAYPTVEAEIPNFDEKQIKIETFHSNGAGGQNVNKVETAIKVTHLQTGIVATCQDERSQFQNKERALKILKEKVQKKIEKDAISKEKLERQKFQTKDLVRTYDFANGVAFDSKTSESCQMSDFEEGRLSKILKSRLV